MKKKKIAMICLCCFLIIGGLCACASNETNAEQQETLINDKQSEEQIETEDMIEKSDESLKLYTGLLGTETADGNISVTDDFLENINSVYIMGKTGTVNHGMTDISETQIRIMEWIDNEASTIGEFESFVSLLNAYWGEDGIVGSYDNMSEETYVWMDYNNSSYVACWHNDNKIKMNWQYDETLESSKEASDLKQIMQSLDGKEDSTVDDDVINKVLEDRQKKTPQIGMTAEEVRQSTWGEPQDINKTTYSWGVKEQWCYSGYRYIYFEDGVVTAIQE